jgi:hypothetical protein
MKIYLSILACLLFSCSNSKENTPKNILSKTAFATILKEIHLEKASFELNKTKDMETAKIKLTNAYFNIYKKNRISEEDFKSALDYYSENPEKLEQIYSNILQDLTNERSKLDPQ